ncbi:unnamed protein product, partial [Pylaiella littoralis]
RSSVATQRNAEHPSQSQKLLCSTIHFVTITVNLPLRPLLVLPRSKAADSVATCPCPPYFPLPYHHASTMLATTSSASNSDGGVGGSCGIQTLLRQHDANKQVLSQVDLFQRPWRTPAAPPGSASGRKHQHQQERNASSISCVELQNSTLDSSSCAAMVCNTAASAKPPSFLFGGETTGSTLSSRSSASTALLSRAPLPASSATPAPAPASGATTSAEHGASSGGMCDPEALLLEPLLISPRSERQNAVAGAQSSTATASIVCEDVHHDDRIMSQSIGNSYSTSTSTSSESSSSSSCTSIKNSTSNHHLGGIMGSRFNCQEVVSGSSGRSWVPASPSMSGLQGNNEPPSFIPDQPLSRGGGGGRRGNGGHHHNDDGWYLKFPSGPQQQHHQRQHQHKHRSHFHHYPTGPGGGAGGAMTAPVESSSSSASSVATAAASIAAEINHATRSAAPCAFSTSATPCYPSVDQGRRGVGGGSGEDDPEYSSAPGMSRYGTYDAYSTTVKDSHQQRTATSWSMPPGQQQQQQRGGGNSSSMMNVESTDSSFRHPRFVTRDDCVPGSRFPRGAGAGGNGSSSSAEHQQYQHQHNQHGFSGVESSFMEDTDSDAMNVTCVPGWHNVSSFCPPAASGGGVAAAASQQSSSENKRLHSQFSAGDGDASMMPSASFRFTEGS